MQDADDPDPGW